MARPLPKLKRVRKSEPDRNTVTFMRRRKIPSKTQAAVLSKCSQRCALCFSLEGDLTEKNGQIAHLDQDSSNISEHNLAWLCLNHHTLYDSKTRQHKNYTIDEIRSAQGKLHSAIAEILTDRVHDSGSTVR